MWVIWMLYEILRRHGDPLDVERGRIMDRLDQDVGEAVTTRQLVGALLIPLAAKLGSDDGCDYLRIVAQLSDRFPAWNVEDDLTPVHLRRILAMIECRPRGLGRAVRQQRTVHVIMLLTAAMAERARLVSERVVDALNQGEFLANLADMIVGALEAPSGSVLA